MVGAQFAIVLPGNAGELSALPPGKVADWRGGLVAHIHLARLAGPFPNLPPAPNNLDGTPAGSPGYSTTRNGRHW